MWGKTKEKIEKYLPMTINSLVLFIIVAYLVTIVGRSVWLNYQSNKDIENQVLQVEELKLKISQLENEIAYYKTNSFKEREARAKLGYKAPGENVLSLAYDQPEEKVADAGSSEGAIKTPNYRLWIDYFSKK